MNSMVEKVSELREFYKDKTVFVTGHTGFKGSWLVALLNEFGANVVGASLFDRDEHKFFSMLVENGLNVDSHVMDVRDREIVSLIKETNPDLVFHLAAQPIVSVGYDDPYLTYTSNVIGTVNVLDGVRQVEKKVSVVNVTTDKVYRNYEKQEGYVETDELMGSDPYSSSKSCAELVSFSFEESFFKNSNKILSTVRAGNVIGGGDFSVNRIVPDLVNGMVNNVPVSIRNFDSIRPYEHVLDALYAYLLLGMEQYSDDSVKGAYNIGPDSQSLMTTKELVNYFESNSSIEIVDASEGEKFHETNVLTLNSNKFRLMFNWSPRWESKKAILDETFKWYSQWDNGYNVYNITMNQIREFLDV